MRSMAKNKEDLPEGFMSPKGWQILKEYYESFS
jgi:hypothetical protein